MRGNNVLILKRNIHNAIVREQEPLTSQFDGKYSDTSLTKLLDFYHIRFRRKKFFLTFLTLNLWGKIKFKKLFDSPPPLQFFRDFAQKSTKTME
jgi:hypothetical protein